MGVPHCACTDQRAWQRRDLPNSETLSVATARGLEPARRFGLVALILWSDETM
jgi:hypothetical protein